MAEEIIECPKCHRKYQVSLSLAGKAFRCRGCDTLVPIVAGGNSSINVEQRSSAPKTVQARRSEDMPKRVAASPVATPRAQEARRPVRSQPRRDLNATRRNPSSSSSVGIWAVSLGSALVTVLAILGIQSIFFSADDSQTSDAAVAVSEPNPATNVPEMQQANRVELGSASTQLVSNQQMTATNNAGATPVPATTFPNSGMKTPPNPPVTPQGSSAMGIPSETLSMGTFPVQPHMKSDPKSVATSSATTPRSGTEGNAANGVASAAANAPIKTDRPTVSSTAVPTASTPMQPSDGGDADKPGRYGKDKFSIDIPEGFELESVDDKPDHFIATWRTTDSSIENLGRLKFDLKYSPSIVAGSRPPLYAQGGVFMSTGDLEVHIATGGTLVPVTIENIEFLKLIYPPGTNNKIQWVMASNFAGVRVLISATSAKDDVDRTLAKVAATFSSLKKDFVVPKVSGPTGFKNEIASNTPAKTGDPSPLMGGDEPNDGSVRWGSGHGKTFSLKQSGVEFSGHPPRYLLIGTEIIDVASSDLVARLPEDTAGGGKAISTDGKRVAHFQDPSSHEVALISIYDATSVEAAPVRIENTKGTWRINFMQFIDETRLLVHTRQDGWTLWDATTGNRIRAFEGEEPNGGGFTLSDDAKYMAVANHRSVVVYDLNKGRVVAKMASAVDGREFNLFWCSGLSFSPDMTELAGLFADGQFIVWSNKGEVLLDEILTDVGKGVGQDRSVVGYLPDKSGWFIDGNKLLDRSSMTFVWEIQKVRWHDPYCCVVDQNYVMTTSDDDSLVFLEIPWEKIKAGMEKVGPGSTPILSPGGAVSIVCNVDQTRFSDVSQVRMQLVDAMRKRLEQNRLKVEDNQPVSIVISYSEAVGDQKRVRSIGFFGGGGGGETVVEDTKIVMNVEMKVDGKTDPVWKESIDVEAGMIVDAKELTPQAFRQENFENVLSRIGRLTFPSRIAGDMSEALPVRTSL